MRVNFFAGTFAVLTKLGLATDLYQSSATPDAALWE